VAGEADRPFVLESALHPADEAHMPNTGAGPSREHAPRVWGALGSAPVVAVGIGVALAYVLGVALWMLAAPGDDTLRTTISDLAPLPLELAAVAVLGVTARRASRGRERQGWTLLALAFAVYGLGDLIWGVLEVGLDQSPFPSVADAFYLAYYPLLAAGLLRFSRRVTERSQKLRNRLDIATVVLGGFIVVYYVLLGPTLQASEPSALATALSIGYPVGDVFLLYAVATLLVRGTSRIDPVVLGVLVASQLAFFAADLGFGAMSSDDSYTAGSWVDNSWLLALALALTAALPHGVRQRANVADPMPAEARRRPAWLPYVALAAGYGVVGFVSANQGVYPVGGVMVCAAGLTGLVVARQVSAIRENSRLLEALQVLATTDSLTGLANRGRFYELAPEVLEDACNGGDPIAVLMIDLDHFKSINDSFGHAVGDQAIQLVAEACRASTPEHSIVARYGGDEIIALLPGVDARRALDHAGRIQQAVNEIRLEADPGRRLTVSIGVAAERGTRDVEDLAGQADAALYRAKHAGRAQASIADSPFSRQ
jgi:diguanylate cyclase (GGDEF)-like protein